MRFLLTIDRRIIFLLVLFAVIAGTLFPEYLSLPIAPSTPVRGIYDKIAALPARSPILISMDFDPASAPELEPMARSTLRQAMGRNLRVIGMTHWPGGLVLTESIIRQTAMEFDDVTLEFVPAASEDFAEEAIAAISLARTAEEREAVLRLAAFGGEARARKLFAEARAAAELAEERGGPGAQPAGEAPAGSPLDRAFGAIVEAAREFPAEKKLATRTVNFVRRPGPLDRKRKARDLLWHLDVGEVAAEPVPVVDASGEVTGYELVRVAARSPTLEYGKDWCFLGYKAGAAILMIAMGQNLLAAFPTDKYNTPTRELAQPGRVLEGVRSLGDLSYLVSFAAGDTAEQWIVYGSQKYGFPMGVGCTAVMAPNLYSFYGAKQITGLSGGIKGAWEYETLVDVPDRATDRAPVQTVAHLLVMALILFCNVAYFAQRFSGGGAGK